MIDIKYESGIYTLETKQKLNTSLENSWEFFSNPKNLSLITPKHMNFNILNNLSEMHEGQIIKYRVSPFPFFRVSWMTEITEVNKPYSFIDEQKKGPFSIWHHEHTFKSNKQGIVAFDKVVFKLPLGWPGIFFGGRIVKNQLKNTFAFRKKILKDIFK